MALLDRIKKRAETDLDDTEIESMIAAAVSEIEQRFGPVGDEITLNLAGRRLSLDVIRPIDKAMPVTITEYDTELDDADFDVVNGGRTLYRMSQARRRDWGTLVRVTYTPIDDSAQRDEVVIELVLLSMRFQGVSKVSVGDVSTDHLSLPDEREKLLDRLAPRKGLMR